MACAVAPLALSSAFPPQSTFADGPEEGAEVFVLLPHPDNTSALTASKLKTSVRGNLTELL
ncbi:hypothetical protein Mkiyose1665_51260 [Mycobacterium kiyosense]|uniref:Uncharacterized protein n=1 Tax=Mycobacterium kiyosense TaxID=2871094 RepID=A0AA37V709_9MYCO|nr:hypothetical protein SRL2020028_45200 [Mycobacterium kiyosense]GLB93161.1 hypothetical protein SRL2020130_59780 [Mycobacterium kiyosense]GLB98318.1 hypothetical protein SRL2020226_50940 [Mycobacterium kiyosense]GLC05056.1 hypothetical protein SRL2020400_56470 [Mycobacterium kiyosense]GLC10265.1 hypothetical protein SRL2020411_49110 [Mycobacterium kiyosense]